MNQNLGSPKAELNQNNLTQSDCNNQSKIIEKSSALLIGKNIAFSDNKNNGSSSSQTKIQNDDNHNNFVTSPFKTHKEGKKSISIQNIIPKLPLHGNLMIY